jgi:threonylcarbamoyladenosine tRNA methylthiotransferase MtaB
MTSAMKTCRLVTLGCKVNQYETQLVQEALEASGYRPAADGESAALCLVNTCSVTAEADAKARQVVRQLHRDNPGAAVVVMGCFAARDPGAVARLPGVSKVITQKTRLAEELAEFGVRRLPRGITRFDGHQRAFVKVQDGCLLNCTFCIIPTVRPIFHSRPVDEIAGEVRQLVDGGCQEIVLTGIHLGHYGLDLSRGKPPPQRIRLWHLIDRLSELPGRFRLRLSSLEAAEVRDDLLRAVAGNPRVCPHFHICLQSGSDAVLARMRRRYTVGGFLHRCCQIRQAVDQPAITTDIIAGFPGESEADFEATCRVAREAGFAQIHIFPFSPRKGTPAAEMPGQVPAQVMAERKSRLAALERELRAAYLRQIVGRRLEVLVEGVAPGRTGFVTGTSCRRVPVLFPGRPEWVRRLVPVWSERMDEDRLYGRPLTNYQSLPNEEQP